MKTSKLFDKIMIVISSGLLLAGFFQLDYNELFNRKNGTAFLVIMAMIFVIISCVIRIKNSYNNIKQ